MRNCIKCLAFAFGPTHNDSLVVRIVVVVVVASVVVVVVVVVVASVVVASVVSAVVAVVTTAATTTTTTTTAASTRAGVVVVVVVGAGFKLRCLDGVDEQQFLRAIDLETLTGQAHVRPFAIERLGKQVWEEKQKKENKKQTKVFGNRENSPSWTHAHIHTWWLGKQQQTTQVETNGLQSAKWTLLPKNNGCHALISTTTTTTTTTATAATNDCG